MFQPQLLPPDARASCIKLAMWVAQEMAAGSNLSFLAVLLKLSRRHVGHLAWIGQIPPEIISRIVVLDPPARILCAEVASRRKHYAAKNWSKLKSLLDGMQKGRPMRKRSARNLKPDDLSNRINCRKAEEFIREALGTRVRAIPISGGGMTVSVELYSIEDVELFIEKVSR